MRDSNPDRSTLQLERLLGAEPDGRLDLGAKLLARLVVEDRQLVVVPDDEDLGRGPDAQGVGLAGTAVDNDPYTRAPIGGVGVNFTGSRLIPPTSGRPMPARGVGSAVAWMSGKRVNI